jgi:uncharacterized protein YbjQ (UPF0145 family)
MTDRALMRAADGATTGFEHEITMTTSDTIVGQPIARSLGLVRGNAVRARHIGRDILAGFRNIVGGEIGDYTKLLAEAREQALSLGADGVVGVRLTTSMVMGGAAELLAYGTAVVFEESS